MHRTENNWLSIGYHFVIRRNGKLEIGREPMAIGAHAKGYNDRSLGICMVGGLDSKGKPKNNFTPEQFDTLNNLLTVLPEVLPNDGVEILGHRDLPNVRKACPCFDVKRWWALKQK